MAGVNWDKYVWITNCTVMPGMKTNRWKWARTDREDEHRLEWEPLTPEEEIAVATMCMLQGDETQEVPGLGIRAERENWSSRGERLEVIVSFGLVEEEG